MLGTVSPDSYNVRMDRTLKALWHSQLSLKHLIFHDLISSNGPIS